jgi:chromatin structure-remodeling complex subunit SFH1
MDWAPVIETLSKEEIENREKERERNMRRMRRETNRYVALPPAALAQTSSFYADPAQDEPMGRGERSKKKRRFRSLSPLNRDTPEATGVYGGGTSLNET